MPARANGFARKLKIVAVSLALAAIGATVSVKGQVLPPDAQQTCTVTQSEFGNWFTSHTATLNGVVDPANSITFSNALDNCVFYKWSHQMFMWLTSPAPSIYGGGDRIFNSPVFFDVTPSVGGHRQFVKHTVGLARAFPLRVAQFGPDNLPVIADAHGNMLEVVSPPRAKSGNPLIRNQAGQLVEVGRLTVAKDGKATFLDRGGKVIAPRLAVTPEVLPRTLVAPRRIPLKRGSLTMRMETVQETTLRNNRLVAKLGKVPLVEGFFFDRKAIFLNLLTNTVVPVEQNQAFGQVLMTHNNSLIYFSTVTNDVYAYYRTGRVHGAISPALPADPTVDPDTGFFPVSQPDLDQVTAFAGKTFVDGIALAIEAKLAWVASSSLPDPQNYIQSSARVPVYTHTTADHWTATGAMTTIRVALLSIHVVGSTNGHAEMIWSTFEHKNNSPRMAFQYNSIPGPNPQTWASNLAGNWVLAANNSPGPFNQPHIDYGIAPDLESISPFHIDGSDTILRKAFGAGFNQLPNPLVPSVAASNTQVISINESVQGRMAAAGAATDLRNNYIQTGATWTENGDPPTASPFPAGNQVGTSRLENTAMETYQQGSDNNGNGFNCFTCHSSNTTDVSHVFSELDPLF